MRNLGRQRIDRRANAGNVANVAMNAEPQRAGWNLRGQPAQASGRISDDAREARESHTGRREQRHLLPAVRAHDDARRVGVRLEPRARCIADVIRESDHRVPLPARAELSVIRQVLRRGIQAEPDAADAARVDRLLSEWTGADRDVGFAPNEVEMARVGDEVDDERWVSFEKWSEDDTHDAAREPLRRRDPHGATQPLVTSARGALRLDRGVLHLLRVNDESLSRRREREPARPWLEQPSTETALERGEAAPDRGLGHRERTRGCRERSVASDREEVANVVPGEHADLNSIYAKQMDPPRGVRVHRDRMNRRTFATLLGGATLAACTKPLARRAQATSRIRAVTFDLFTIFDPRGIDAAVTAEVTDPELAPQWKRRAFEVCWQRAAAGQYLPFDQILVETLGQVAHARTLELTPATAARLVAAWTELAPWPDAPDALAGMRDAGLVLAPLANFAPSMIERLLQRTRLRSLFADVLSTDRARTYKPAARAYQLGVDVLGLPPDAIAFSAFGGWDAAGAAWFGYPAFWVDRLGTSEVLTVEPAGRGPDLPSLATWIAAR